MAAKLLGVVLGMLVIVELARAAQWEPPIDDAYSFTHLAEFLAPGESLLGQADAAVMVVESETKGDCHVYVARVVSPLRGVSAGQLIAFTEPVMEPDWYLRRSISGGEGGLWPYPRLAARREYLIFMRQRTPVMNCRQAKIVRESGLPVIEHFRVVRADLHGINDILPELQRLAEALDRPAPERPGPLRKILFANLGTKHEYLRHLTESEFAYNDWAYPGMTKDEATRLADYSEGIDNFRRFHILEKLATKTPYPMDHWYLRALSRNTPNRIRAGDTEAVMSFDDSLNRAAPFLSIDSFWPMLERKTRPMSLWVHAFAKKRDPRLLPIILRYLDPTNLDPTAAEALQNYRGVPAAEDAVVRAATDTKVKSDKRARALARESLKRIGTPRALLTAEQLLDDADGHARDPAPRK